jgi:hypothetical protein
MTHDLSNPILTTVKGTNHSMIFSIFSNESEKSLTKTHDISNPISMSVKGTNHLAIFSIFNNESEKSLTKTRLEDSRRKATGEAKAPVLIFCGMLVSYEELTSSGRPKSLQVEEDKVLTEVIVSVLCQIMSLPRKDIGGGIGYPTRPSQ